MSAWKLLYLCWHTHDTGVNAHIQVHSQMHNHILYIYYIAVELINQKWCTGNWVSYTHHTRDEVVVRDWGNEILCVWHVDMLCVRCTCVWERVQYVCVLCVSGRGWMLSHSISLTFIHSQSLSPISHFHSISLTSTQSPPTHTHIISSHSHPCMY